MIGGPYSELDYLILAMVGEGTSSGYAMRKQMTRMRGGRWSSESGSVYRVLRRLEKDGLLTEARRVGVPNRERTEYEITERGTSVLHSWLSFTPDRGEFGYLVDPIRTRAYFLARLKPTEQARVVKAWMVENKGFMAEIEKDLVEIGMTPIGKAAYANLVYLAAARNEWLKKLLTTIRTEGRLAAEAAEAVATS